MFKGLKSKIAEESKKIQSTAVQLGENLASTVLSRTGSEVGSDHGSVTEQYSTPNVSADGPALIDISSPNHGIVLSDSQIKPSSSLMEEFSLEDTSPVRQRRDSGSSIASTDSVNNVFNLSFSNSRRLDTIPSDVESTVTDMDTGYIGQASKEQISSVLHKLQGRASNYKDKYRQLVKMYNEIVKENEKCRTVLTAAQDKALTRIERLKEEKKQLQDQLKANNTSENGEKDRVAKLEDLLNRCKEHISNNKQKIQTLQKENDELKEKVTRTDSENGNADFSDMVAERIASEWRVKLESAEKEWAVKVTDATERSSMAVAQTKLDMHSELESKDSALQEMLRKLRVVESDAAKQTEVLTGELDEMRKTVQALEGEKNDLIETLSKTKTEAVRLVKADETKKRDELHKTFEERLSAKDAAVEEQISKLHEVHKKELQEQNEQFQNRIREHEEQMQLAIEEREMQKMAAVTEQDRKNDDLGCLIEKLTTEKLELQGTIDQMTENDQQKNNELVVSIEDNSKRHQQEMEIVIEKHEQERQQLLADIDTIRQQLDQSVLDLQQWTNDKDWMESEMASLNDQLNSAQSQIGKLSGELESKSQQVDQQSNEEFNQMRQEIEGLKSEKNTLATNCSNLNITLEDKESTISQTQSNLEESNSKLSFVENEKIELTSEIGNLQRNAEEQEIAKNALSEQLREKTHGYQIVEKQVQDLAKLVGEIKTEMANKDNELVENGVLIEKLRSEVVQKETEFRDKLDNLIQSKSVELEDLQTHSEQLKQAEIGRLEARMAEFEQESNSKTAVLKMKLKEHVEKLASTQESLKDAENRVNDQNASIGRLTSDLNDRKSELEKFVNIQIDLEQQIKTKQKQLDSAQIEKSKIREELETSHQELKQLVNEREKFEQQFVAEKEEITDRLRNEQEQRRSAEAENERLERDLTEFQVDLNRLRERLSQTDHDQDGYTSQLADKDTKIQRLLAEIEHLRMENDNKATTMGSLQIQVMEMERIVKETVERSDKQCTELADRLHIKERDYSEISDKFEVKERCVTDSEASCNQMETEIAEQKEKLQSNVELLKKAESKNNQLQETLEQQQSNLLAVEEHFKKVEQNYLETNNSKEGQINELKKEIGQVTEELNDRKKCLEQLNAGQSLAQEELTKQSQESIAARQKLKKTIESVENETKEKQIIIDDLNQKLSEATSKMSNSISELQTQLNSKDSDLNEMSEKFKKEQSLNELNSGQIDNLKVEIDKLQTELESNQLLLKEMQEQAEIDKSSLTEQMESKINSYKKKAEAKLSQMKKQLEEERERYQLDNDGKTDRLEVEIKEKTEIMDNLKALEAEHEQLKKTFSEIETVSAERAAALKALEEKKSDSETKVASAIAEKDDMAEKLKIVERTLANEEAKLSMLSCELEEKGKEMNSANNLRDEIRQLEAENLEKEDKLHEFTEQLDTLRAQLTDCRGNMEISTKETLDKCREEYEAKLSQMDQTHREEMKTALKQVDIEMEKKETEWQQDMNSIYAKTDEDRQRVTKEYQREVKQLYKDLNDRAQTIEAIKNAHEAQIKVKDDEIASIRSTFDEFGQNAASTSTGDSMGQQDDDMMLLRNRVSDLEAELIAVEKKYKREMDLLTRSANDVSSQNSLHEPLIKPTFTIPLTVRTEPLRSIDLDSTFPTSPLFAEPTEAEYLRNVLYRYMTERETLGKESVTLARVIATVLKFNEEQTRRVMTKEEARQQHSWYPVTH